MSKAQNELSDYFDDVPFTGGESSISPPEEQMSVDDPNAGDGQSLPVQDCAQDIPVEKKQITLRVGLYYDGTGNNRANVTAGRRADEEDREAGLDEEDYRRKDWSASYGSDYSNVERLERAAMDYIGYDGSTAIYVEGIGTIDGGPDDPLGSATGEGGTGVKGKTFRGKLWMERWVAGQSRSSGEYVSKLHLDYFGFSRGAAAARYAVYACFDGSAKVSRTLYAWLAGGADVKPVFVGIYDTVAAYGKFSHADDYNQLGLGAISRADFVVHLAAAEEYRINFSLNPFYGANGFEAYLPGAHSDVGGGYNVNTPEDVAVFDRQFWWVDEAWEAQVDDTDWLVESGWYREDDITYVGQQARGKRSNVRGYYSRIPLHIMAVFADYHGVIYDLAQLNNAENKVQPDLEPMFNRLMSYCVAVEGGAPSNPDDWINETGEPFFSLRYNELHMSANYSFEERLPGFGGIPMRPYFVREGSRIAKRWRRRIGPGGIEAGPPGAHVDQDEEASAGRGA
ncbi:DUF2235 domain-containing protein [Oceanicola sp. D3]|uniref:phospholipase effector Tle1 domain-containing protein n=1 Tax=Oceanicola sp. D3 TaxID=2587163 RepID=UPI0011216E67|nr:DUF2235 domain-containing protein [Oceanicola sp. D3]QDC10743.1 DUF2235 domain-containing protein [Oceanicola sp. D3]